MEINRVITGHRFLAALAMFCSVLAIADPLLFQNPVILPWRLAFWSANGLFVVVCWYVLFRVLVWSRRAFGHDWAIPSAAMIVVSVTALLHANYWLAGIVLNMPELWVGRLYWDVLRYSFVAVVFETAVAALLLPVLLQVARRHVGESAGQAHDGSAARAGPAESTNVEAREKNRIEVNGRRVEPGEVLYLKAAEHYVEVVLQDTQELVRSSLREMIDQLQPADGVQPHRSYWVMRDAIVGLNRVNGGQFLVLRNGDEIPVSRHRKGDVSDWVRRSLRNGDG